MLKNVKRALLLARNVPIALAMGNAVLANVALVEIAKLIGHNTWPPAVVVKFALEIMKSHCSMLGIDPTAYADCPICGVTDKSWYCAECGEPVKMSKMIHSEVGSALDEMFMHHFVAFCPPCHKRDVEARKQEVVEQSKIRATPAESAK